MFLPSASGTLARRVQRPQTTLYDVVNVGEIPGEIDPVFPPVHSYRLPLENVSGKEEVSHVGSSPGAIDGEESQPGY
uniref:Uncharacterized protein n=1 Tax=Nelumbo nucifera TaxID=4432 RepID=A0A822ZK63_NELNU|nr:TPA_asm: hypothetical protein HUJ06_003772 [Nelumbo nucifera]